MDWQKILWDLRKDYKPLKQIALDIGVSANSLQKAARIGVRSDIHYSTGVKLVELHGRHCKCGNK